MGSALYSPSETCTVYVVNYNQFMNRSADSFAGTPDGAFIAACKTVCNPSLAPPHQSSTQSVTPTIHYTHIIAPTIHTAKKTTPHTHTALQIRLRAPGVGL